MPSRRSLAALALLVACLLAIAPTAGAQERGEVAGFEVMACATGGLTPAPSGGVLSLICERGPGGKEKKALGHLLPSGKVVRGPVPQDAVGPLAAGPAGEVWAIATHGTRGLGLLRVAANGTVTDFALGTAQEGNTLEAYGLIADGDGSAWIAIGELAPAGFTLQPYESLGGELLHVTADGTVTHFPVPEEVEPHALVLGPDGNLWFCGERGRTSSEHSSYPGKGYVGRMTPAGAFVLFATPTEQSSPGGIAVGPEGRLWFTETSNYVRGIGSIGTDGTFGPSLKARNAYLQGSLAFGPEGDAWLAVLGGTMRITLQGRQTVFPSPEPWDIVAGAGGDIWAGVSQSVERIVPGAPGIDTLKIDADRRSATAVVQLACSGSERACEGILQLFLPAGRGTKHGARLIRAQYSVASESTSEMTLHLPAKALALARHATPRRAGVGYAATVIVHATVAGGPALDRRIRVPGLVSAAGS